MDRGFIIEAGDIVSVNINAAKVTVCSRGKVLQKPQATGDSWVFMDLITNSIIAVSEGCTIALLEKADPFFTREEREIRDFSLVVENIQDLDSSKFDAARIIANNLVDAGAIHIDPRHPDNKECRFTIQVVMPERTRVAKEGS